MCLVSNMFTCRFRRPSLANGAQFRRPQRVGRHLWISGETCLERRFTSHSALSNTTQKNGRSLEKDPLFLGGIQPVAGSYALTMAPWEEHSRQRRALAHPFSNTALVQQEPLIQGHMDTFVSCLAKLAGPDGLDPVNVSDWLSYATFDIIGDLVFAEPFGCMEAGQSTEWSKSVVKAIKCGAWEQATRRAAGTGTWLQRQMVAWLIPEQYRRWRLNHFLKSKEKALKRLADQDADHRDLIYFMLRNAESTKGLTQMEILLNSALFM